MKEFEELVLDIDGFGIFTHNTTLACQCLFLDSALLGDYFLHGQLALHFAAIVTMAPELSAIPPLSILFLSPFGIMEFSLVAYSLGISRVLYSDSCNFKKINLTTFIKPTIIEIGIVVGLLLAGGYLEFYMIELVEEGGLDLAWI